MHMHGFPGLPTMWYVIAEAVAALFLAEFSHHTELSSVESLFLLALIAAASAELSSTLFCCCPVSVDGLGGEDLETPSQKAMSSPKPQTPNPSKRSWELRSNPRICESEAQHTYFCLAGQPIFWC